MSCTIVPSSQGLGGGVLWGLCFSIPLEIQEGNNPRLAVGVLPKHCHLLSEAKVFLCCCHAQNYLTDLEVDGRDLPFLLPPDLP